MKLHIDGSEISMTVLPDEIYLFDEKGTIIYVNRNAPLFFGEDAEHVIGKSIHTLPYLHSISEQHKQALNQLISDGIGFSFTMQYLVQEKVRNFDIQFTKIKGASYRSIYELCVHELTESSAKILSSPVEILRLSDTSFESVFISENGICVGLNKEAEREFSITSSEIIGKPLTDLVHPDFQQQVQQRISSESEIPYEVISRRTDGTCFQSEVRARMLQLADRNLRVTVVRNIDFVKTVESENKSYIQYLENLEIINRTIQKSSDIDSLNENILEAMLKIFNADRAYLLHPCDLESETFEVKIEKTKPEYPGALQLGQKLSMNPEMIYIFNKILSTDSPADFYIQHEYAQVKDLALRFGVKSALIFALFPRHGKPWQVGLHQCSHSRVWTDWDKRLLKEISLRLTDTLDSMLLMDELKKSEEQYRSLVETAHEGLLLMDIEGKIQFINEQMAQMTGYSKEELLGKPIFSFLTRKDEHIGHEQLENRKQGKVSKYEISVINRSGQEMHLLVSASPWKENNQIVGARLMVMNITDLKKVSVSLQKSEAKYQQIVETTREGLLLTDEFGTIQFANKHAAMFFGKLRDDMSGISIENLITNATFLELLSRIKANSNSAPEEIELNVQPNSIRKQILHFSISAVQEDHEFQGFLILIVDVTERRKIELEKEKITNDLVRRNHDLEQFAYIVSHNLRSPVSNILGINSILQDPAHAPSDNADLISTMNKSVHKLDMVIHDLNEILNLRQNNNRTRERIDLELLCLDITSSLRLQIELESAQVIWDFSSIRFMQSVKSYLHSILLNLISNAIKYRRKEEAPRIEIASQNLVDSVLITIRDNGLGIDLSRYGDAVFGLYQRFHRSIEGHGVGLFMVKTQVEMLGGKIRLESQPGKGSIFYVELPIHVQ